MAEALTAAVTILAILGGTALVVRLVRAGFHILLTAAEATAAAGLADVSARRGDLTGMMERRAAEHHARRARRTSLALSTLWIAWLVIPIYSGWVREAFAVAALLWLLPYAPPASQRHPTRAGPTR